MRVNDMTAQTGCGPCSPKPELATRSLISLVQAGGLERTFKVLANATRLRLLHALVRQPGLSVTALAQAVRMKPQAVSNQLQRLVAKGILSNARNGTSIHYRIVDPCVMRLLDQGLCLTEDTWERQSRMSRKRTSATSEVARQLGAAQKKASREDR
jgi:ArsR family transcriptional regulator, lead/cadmium/zinc/bismuth-responsive transcriptional repressor